MCTNSNFTVKFAAILKFKNYKLLNFVKKPKLFLVLDQLYLHILFKLSDYLTLDFDYALSLGHN